MSNCQLKYVAEFNNGKAKVGLKEISEGHPFYDLKGKDNIVMFYSKRYPDHPVVESPWTVHVRGLHTELRMADVVRIGHRLPELLYGRLRARRIQDGD